MSAEAPRPIEMTSSQAPSGEISAVTLSQSLMESRQPSTRKKLGIMGAVTLATAAAFAPIAARVSAQGADASPAASPTVSFEPGASIDPNGVIAQGEVPCEPGQEVVPAALLDAAPSASPSFIPESPAPLPTGGDLLGGEPDPSCAPEVSPLPSISPVPSETPHVELANPYILDALIDLSYQPIAIGDIDDPKPNTYASILVEQAQIIFEDPKIAAAYKTVEAFVEHDFNGMNEYINVPTVSDGGTYLAMSVNAALNNAEGSYKSNPKIAKAWFTLGDATRRLIHKYINFGTKKHARIDKLTDDLIKKN